MRRLSVLAAAVATLLTASVVLATPSSGITPTTLARGNSAAAYTITHTGNREIATVTTTFAPGSYVGWHSHPGPVATIVASGSMSIWFSSDCAMRTVNTGQAIVVPGGTVLDYARNDGATNLTLVQTYYNVPVGGALRTDATTPACAPPAPQDLGMSAGVASVLHSRVRLASDLNFVGAANTDLMIQSLAFAAGGSTGWHSHHGPLTVAIESGSLDYVHSDCTTTTYAAGTAFLDTTMTHRADSAGATTAFVTYTSVPAGAEVRIDQNAPACATAASASASAIPDTASDNSVAGLVDVPLLGALLVAIVSLGGSLLISWRRRSI